MNTKKEKQALRAELRKRRDSLPSDVRSVRDAAIVRVIRESSSYRMASFLLGYAPIGSEVDIMPLLSHALSVGKAVFLPRVRQGGRMTFHRVPSLDSLKTGAYGIPEPNEEAEMFCGTRATLCLVPGLGFDRLGFRIGYGGGYYDRFFGQYSLATLGVLHREFVLDTLPSGQYDRRVAALATECGILPIPQ